MALRNEEIFNYIPSKLTFVISKLGYCIGSNPIGFVGVFFLLAIFLGTGLQRIEYVIDNEYLFVPTGAPGIAERDHVESLFNLDYSSNYILGHETRFLAQVAVIVKAKDPVQDGIQMHNGIMEMAKRVDADVNKVKIHSRIHGSFQFKDVCAKTRLSEGLKCQVNDFVNMSPTLDLIRLGRMNMTYPMFIDPYSRLSYFVPAIFGNLKLDDEKTVVIDASAVKLMFILDSNLNNYAKSLKVKIWEEAILNFILQKDWNDTRYDVLAINAHSLEKELSENIDTAFVLLNYSVAFIAAFTVMNGFILKSIRHGTPFTALWGIINTMLGTMAGWGLLMYTGLCPWQAINLASVVLLLGVGIDDTFVMLSAWHRQSKPDQDMATNMAETYKEAAVSITITSLTNICSFGIGIFVPSFATVSIFCAYTTIGLLAVYLWTLFFYGAAIALCQQMSDRTFDSDQEKTCSRFNNFGRKVIGFAFEAPNLKPFTAVIFESALPYIMEFAVFKLFVMASWLAMISVAGYLVTEMKEGLEKSRVGRYNSPVANYFWAEDKYFQSLKYRIDIVVDQPGLDYADPEVQVNIASLINRFQSLPLMSNYSELTENWLEQFIGSPFKDQNKDFITGLKRFLDINKKTPLPMNINFNGSQIQACRFFLQSNDITNSVAEVELLESLRSVAKSAVYNVTVFHPFFPYFDQFAGVFSNTMQCLGFGTIIVVLVTVALIPNFRGSLWLIFAIVSIEVCVAGFMVSWNIYLDVISMITLIMCIGFSVDFCAHICNHFFSSEAMATNERIRESLAAYGPPIFQGGISTLIAVIPLFYANSYILETFAKMVTLVITLGMAHGILILPVCLSLMPDSSPSVTSTPTKSPSAPNHQD